jgi:hypothetical protein
LLVNLVLCSKEPEIGEGFFEHHGEGMAAEVFGRTCEHQEADLFGEFNEAVQFEDLEVRSLGVELNVDFLSEVLDFFERNVVFETEVFQKLIEIGRTDEYAFLCDLIKVLWDLAFLVS